MLNTIKYYYKMEIDTLYNDEKGYYFYFNDYKYYFIKYNRPLEDIKELEIISYNLFLNKIPCHYIIKNFENNSLTKYNDENYCLLKINGFDNDNVSLKEMLYFNNYIKVDTTNKLFRNNWASLWEEKIDYFEYQVSELAHHKEIILNSFSYYIGLAENAITYYNKTINNFKEHDRLVICHKRIKYPNIAINYYNPLEFVIDYEVRDIASYLKSLFFNGKDVFKELENYIKIKHPTSFSINLLYCRMLFPSYYFDLYENIINYAYKEDILIKVIKKQRAYEIFLKDLYFYLNKITPIFKIEWIVKN